MTAAPVLAFRVAGQPTTQGSKSAFVVKSKATGQPRAVMFDQKPERLQAWRESIRSTAAETAGDAWEPLSGPVRVDLWLALPKPASTPKKRRVWPIGGRSGDADKLARACLDAITQAGIWRDDSQVVELRVVKDYPEHVQQLSPGVIVRVWRVDSQVPPPSTGQIPIFITPGEGANL